jgi:hypothetical protein
MMIDKKTILELIQLAHQEARDTVGYYNDDYEAIFQEKLVDISVRYGMSIKWETLPVKDLIKNEVLLIIRISLNNIS